MTALMIACTLVNKTQAQWLDKAEATGLAAWQQMVGEPTLRYVDNAWVKTRAAYAVAEVLGSIKEAIEARMA